MNYPDATPFSTEAEEAVLGSVLSHAPAYHDAAAKLPTPDAFFLLRHQYMWQAIQRIVSRGQDFDYLTVSKELQDMGKLEEVGGPMYLLRCVNNTPSAVRVEAYADIVATASVRRRLLAACDAIKAMAMAEEKGIDTVLHEAEKELLDALGSLPEKHTAHLKESVKSVWEYVEEAMKGNNDLMGIPTGFKVLDGLLRGMKRGNLLYVAGRPGTGKSAFLLSIAMNVARRNQRVMFWTGEMNADEVAARALAAESGINGSDLISGNLDKDKAWPRFVESAGRVGRLPIWIDDTPAVTMPALRATAMRQATKHGLDLLIVDYIGLMKATGYEGQRVQEIGALSRGLKSLAVELNIPVLCAAQLNRDLEKRQDKRPQLSDLRDSGDLEQDGNVVMFLYPNFKQNTTDVLVAKHRGGATGDVPLIFEKPTTRFVDALVTPVW